MNKKGSGLDLFYIGITLLVFSFAALIGFKIYNGFNTQVQGIEDLSDQGKTASSDIRGLYPGVIDNSFIFLTVVLGIGAFVFAALVRFHPVFLIPYIIFLFVVIFMSAVFSNIYQEMASNPSFTALVAEMGSMNTVMTALPWIVGVLGGILAIVMYKTWSGAGY